MMTLKLKNGLTGAHPVSKYLMGQNLEMYSAVVKGLLSDRLMNPKFTGPENPKYGTADEWIGNPYHCRLISGMGMSSDEAQLIQRTGGGVRQYGIKVYAGETLEVELWAKVRHSPVNLQVALKAAITRRPAYAAAKIAIDAAYWKKYAITLDIPVTDASADFCLTLLDEDGAVFIDQVHLRPAGQPHLDPKAIAAAKSISPTALRFPGGCLSTVYHWANGVGPVHLRPSHYDPQFFSHLSYDFGITEYLDLCCEADITPHLTVNIGNGTPGEAAELARYCRRFYEDKGIPPPRIFFQMGNEQFAAHETSHMTGDMYIAALRAFVPPVKTEYPNSTMIGIGYPYSGAYSAREQTPWRELVLDQAADLVDMISNHYYKGQWKETFADQLQNAVESLQKIKADLLKMIADIKARNLKTKIGVTEWNYWLYASDYWTFAKRSIEPMDPHHCLFVAGMLQMMAELGEYVELSNYYQLLNGLSIFTNFAGACHESPMALIFRYYRPAFPGEYIPLASLPSEASGGRADALCLKTADGVYLFIVNHSLAESAVTLPNIFAESTGELLVFDGRENGVECVPRKEKVSGNKIILPPMAVCRFFCRASL
ncbi:MAG: hypothetical protein PHW60_11905 [Kiritimatiellae bacterium]|nr:hypothetical protein [Kiritimatiellia bacterium]